MKAMSIDMATLWEAYEALEHWIMETDDSWVEIASGEVSLMTLAPTGGERAIKRFGSIQELGAWLLSTRQCFICNGLALRDVSVDEEEKPAYSPCENCNGTGRVAMEGVRVTESCGEYCRCVDYADFPTERYRLHPELREANDA